MFIKRRHLLIWPNCPSNPFICAQFDTSGIRQEFSVEADSNPLPGRWINALTSWLKQQSLLNIRLSSCVHPYLDDKYFMQKVNPRFLQPAEVMYRPPTRLLIDQQGSLNLRFISYKNQFYTLGLGCSIWLFASVCSKVCDLLYEITATTKSISTFGLKNASSFVFISDPFFFFGFLLSKRSRVFLFVQHLFKRPFGSQLYECFHLIWKY